MNLLPLPQADSAYFLPYQLRWLDDDSPLKIVEKSRQIGLTYVDAYDSVIKASSRKAMTATAIGSGPKPFANTPPQIMGTVVALPFCESSQPLDAGVAIAPKRPTPLETDDELS